MILQYSGPMTKAGYHGYWRGRGIKLVDCLNTPEGNFSREIADRTGQRPLIGVFKGCGIGPEVIDATLQVLASAKDVTGIPFEVEQGGLIGETALAQSGEWLPANSAEFCADIFKRGGAILSGPGGGRYVYDLRRQFDLFCKFVPVRPAPELRLAGKLLPQHLQDVDILIVRDNTGGVYQGLGSERVENGERIASHSFQYAESEIRRLVAVAARAAAMRGGRMHVITKDAGVPEVSKLWMDTAGAVAREAGIEAACMNIDFAAYELIQNPSRFDVIVTPNLFGDILADISGVLLASRGVTFSGNYDAQGHGVYQTNHGCATDLQGTDTANPAGQILSLAMLLRESFGMDHAAALIERSLAEIWRQGWRTPDLREEHCRITGTKEMADRVAEQIPLTAETMQPYDARAAAC